VTTQKELIDAYRNIFLHLPEGQLVLRDMMKASGLFQITGVRTPEEVQHLEGSRDMVRRIVSFLGLDDEQVMKIGIGVIDDE
tara:strand:+ start:759 stop:1004 length:246 start_codon:yes stop_codon:yes gene_type:complete